MNYFKKAKAVTVALFPPVFLRIMKLTVILVILAVTQMFARGYSQDINLDVHNMPLEKVFILIEQQSGYVFFYDNQLVKDRRLSLKVENSSIYEILQHSFKDLPLEFTIVKGKNIVVKRRTKRVNPITPITEQQPVRGKITNSMGEPLEGVTVNIRGSATGTVTDASGNFVLSAPLGSTVSISMVGYVAVEIPISSYSPLSLVLEPDNQNLEEVVVTALGITRERKSLSYAVTEVGGESFTKARENNIGNALSGKIAGVNATSSATGPAGSSRVIIRGNGSLSGNNQPLYVINGVPMNSANQGTPGTYGGRDMGDGLTSINPDDIESISVLKGGTAAALYGSRAANGVILITTKSGSGRQGIGVDYSSTFTAEMPLTLPDWQYNYGSGSRGEKPTTQSEAVAYGRTSWGAPLDGSMVIQPDGQTHPYSAQTNNFNHFYDTGTAFSNTLALNGGNENANFRFSISNMNNKGLVPNSSFKRQTFNLSANARLAEKVIFEGRAQYSIENTGNRTSIADFTANPNSSLGLLATNIDVRTLSPGYDASGYEMPWNDYVYVTNPYFAINKVKNDDQRKRFIGSFSVRYNITDYLYAQGRLGIDYINRYTYNLTPTGILYNARGTMSTGHDNLYETNAEAILGFEKTLNRFSLNVFVGGNKMYNQNRGGTLNSGNFNVPFQYFISNGSSQTFTDSFEEWGINSLFGAADIGFNDILYLNFTGRQDWFSTLSPESNRLFYPSVGASFIASEAWKSKPTWLNYTKVRASWAQVGGGAPDPYGLDLTYSTGSINHLGQPLMSISSSTIPTALKPYTSTTLEAGLEFRLFDNRLGADITLYDRSTTNDIVRATIPPSTSYNNVQLNIGEIRNKGIEVLLTGNPIRSSDGLNWDISLNAAYNNNRVINISDNLTGLAGAQPRTLNAYVYHYEGYPYGMIAGHRKRTDENGNIVYNNANGLPLQSELVPLGRGVPPLTLGLNNAFSYKNFYLDFLFDGKFGSIIYSSTNAYGTNYGLHKRTAENGVRETGFAVNGVDQNGNAFEQLVPAQEYFQGTAFTITEDFITDASFVKLRQLTFGYTFPQKLLAGTPLQSASLSFVARNLLMIYNEADNVDPESSYSVSGDAQGLENFGVPTTKSFGVNLAVRF